MCYYSLNHERRMPVRTARDNDRLVMDHVGNACVFMTEEKEWRILPFPRLVQKVVCLSSGAKLALNVDHTWQEAAGLEETEVVTFVENQHTAGKLGDGVRFSSGLEIGLSSLLAGTTATVLDARSAQISIPEPQLIAIKKEELAPVS